MQITLSDNETLGNNLTVGNLLTLNCTVTAVEGISGSVNIIWTTGNDVLRRAENLSVTYTINNFAIYTDLYEISSLTLLDNGRNYECTVLINASQQINRSDQIVLNFTGELIQNSK